jgi:serine/threonine-protein kinase RsbW
MPKVELHIGALAIHVRTARLVAASLGRRIGLDAVVIDEVKLAVGEACARAVNVHHASGATDPIIVQFRDDDEMLEVAVLDCGPGGTRLPSTAAAGASYDDSYDSSADGLPAGNSGEGSDSTQLTPGLGLAMIAGLVDDVTIEDRSAPGGTVVTMRWPVTSF